VAWALAEWRPRGLIRRLAAISLGIFALFAVIKATNEPAASNVWTFYLPAEIAATDFIDQRLRDSAYWGDFDERLRAAHQLTARSISNAVFPVNFQGTRTYLITDVIRLRAARFRRPLPAIFGELRVYDNGTAQVYRARARTPYQE
jgi:hypothetical protein